MAHTHSSQVNVLAALLHNRPISSLYNPKQMADLDTCTLYEWSVSNSPSSTACAVTVGSLSLQQTPQTSEWAGMLPKTATKNNRETLFRSTVVVISTIGNTMVQCRQIFNMNGLTRFVDFEWLKLLKMSSLYRLIDKLYTHNSNKKHIKIEEKACYTCR